MSQGAQVSKEDTAKVSGSKRRTKVVKPRKPKGVASPFALFIGHQREELRRVDPNSKVEFFSFGKSCRDMWKTLPEEEKEPFRVASSEDRERYNEEMKNGWMPTLTKEEKPKRKKKDPNAPKRPMSAFFLYCNDVRATVRAEHPEYKIPQMSKELSRRWTTLDPDQKSGYQTVASLDQDRYHEEKEKYDSGKATEFLDGLSSSSDEGDTVPLVKRPCPEDPETGQDTSSSSDDIE